MIIIKRKYIKLTYEEVVEYMKNINLTVVSKEFKGVNSKIDFYDLSGYFYSCVFANIKNGQSFAPFHKSNPYSIQNIILWLNLNNKNFSLVSNVYEKNNKKLNFKCNNVECGEIFDNTWNDIQKGQNCPFCNGQRVNYFNCLATNYPNLEKEWDYEKNGNITPYNIRSMSNSYVYWKCCEGHSWNAQISARTRGTNCPYCSNKVASIKNNLSINNLLLIDWDYNKNIKLPINYTLNSSKKVFWECNKCGHSWEASIKNRNLNKSGCPKCNQSKGESEIESYLIKNNIFYIPQKEYDNLIGVRSGNLSYDFYLPDYNILIEYQGQFHDGSVKFQSQEDFDRQKEHDKRKLNYSILNNITLIEIWYWDFENIESILNKLIKY